MNVYPHPIESLCDTDAYKISMGQCILHNFPKDKARFDWHLRSDEKIGWLKPLIDEELDYICNLRFTKDELDYLSKIPWLSDDYIDYLERFYLKRDQIHTEIGKDGELVMWAEGPWRDVSFFEIPCLAIVSELYMRNQHEDFMGEAWKFGDKNLTENIAKLKKCYNEGYKFTLADFGARRRFTREWHRHVVERLKNEAPEFFVGTSDVLFAKEFGIKPIGTFAHEFVSMMLNNTRIADAQKLALNTWANEFRGELGIALSDTFGFYAFLKDFDKYFAKLFDGCRHDSGDPIKWGYLLIEHYKKMNIDPFTKTGCWSDSLNTDECIKIVKEFYGKIKVSFGVGTHLTNNVGVKPLNMVMKATSSNGKPVCKISDTPGKLMCKNQQFIEYVKSVYNYKSIDD